MVFGKRSQVVVTAAYDPDERDFVRVDFLQPFAVTNRDQPVFCPVNDISVAIHALYPFVCSQVVSHNDPDRQHGYKSFNYFQKTIIRRIEDQVTGFVV